MINIKSKNIENVYFGNKTVEKVYCGSKLVFENKKSAVTDDTLLKADFNNIFNDTEFWSVDRGNIAYLEDDCIFLRATYSGDKVIGANASYNTTLNSLVSRHIALDKEVTSQDVSISIMYKGSCRLQTLNEDGGGIRNSFYSEEDKWTVEHINQTVSLRGGVLFNSLCFRISPGKKRISDDYLIDGVRIKWIVVKKGKNNFVDEF